MNRKIARALLWEEFTVGGAIVGTCAAVGLILQLCFPLIYSGNWSRVSDDVLFLTLGLPLVAALTLVFNTANTGHLTSGFSRRILRLPVRTRATTLIVLLSRLTMVLALSVFLTATCHLVFGDGPSARVAFYLVGSYLFIQLVDWGRRVSTAVLPTAAAIFIVLLLLAFSANGNWETSLVAGGALTPAFVAGCLLTAVAACALAVVFVQRARCGETAPPMFRTTTGVLDRVQSVRTASFSSPLSAQVWFQLRMDGLVLPLATLLFWLAGLAIGLVIQFAGDNDGVHFLLHPIWLFEFLPAASLVLACIAWVVFNRLRGNTKRERPATFLHRQPLTAAQRASATLIATAIQFLPLIALVGVARVASFYLSDGGTTMNWLLDAVADGNANWREIAAILVGPVLLVALLGWSIMALGSSPRTFFAAAVTIALWFPLLPLATEFLPRTAMAPLAVVALWTVLLAPPLALGWHLIQSLRLGLVPGRTATRALMAWFLIAVAVFPFSELAGGQAWPPALVLASLALAAAPVLPVFSVTMATARRAGGEGLSPQHPDQHRRGESGWQPGAHKTIFALAGVAVLAIAWIRWPAEPAWHGPARANGLPVNLAELDAWYKELPPNENAAIAYLSAAETATTNDQAWFERFPDASTEDGADSGDAAIDNVVIVGNAQVDPVDPISPEVWEWSKRYYENVVRTVCDDLHRAAQTSFSGSRYPIDFTLGTVVDFTHLSGIRNLARVLFLESWVAAAENRPDDALAAALDILPIADSLQDEPILISQLVRIAIDGIACEAIGNVLNRTQPTSDALHRTQTVLATRMRASADSCLMNRGQYGEQIFIVSQMQVASALEAVDSSLHTDEETPPAEAFAKRTLTSLLAPLFDVYGQTTLEPLLAVSRIAGMRTLGDEMLARHDASLADAYEEEWDRFEMMRAPMASVLLPALERAYDAEWRKHTNLNLVITAIALERYRLDHGRLPKKLVDIVPDYLDEVPRDFWNPGKPLSYRIRENGAYTVFSYGYDFENDHGDEVYDDKGNRAFLKGDIHLTVVPPDQRVGVAPAAT